MTNIAIIVEDDLTWNLPLWEKTIPILIANNLNVTSIIVCKKILGKLKGKKIFIWYLLTFGLSNFLKLSIYASIIYLKRKYKYFIKGDNRNFFDLSKKYNCNYYECNSPNEEKIINKINSLQIDIVLIMTSYILSTPIINSAKIGIINKHASALPTNKGLFPYFWSVINKSPQGVSLHEVNSKIDSGKILFQKLEIPEKNLKSMISFYYFVFNNYSQWIIVAINNLINNQFLNYNPDLEDTYFSLPTKNDFKVFKRNRGKIITLEDIIKCLKYS